MHFFIRRHFGLSSPRGRAPRGLPGLSWVLPGASPAPPSRSSLGSPGGSPRVTRVFLGLPGFSRALSGAAQGPWEVPGTSRLPPGGVLPAPAEISVNVKFSLPKCLRMKKCGLPKCLRIRKCGRAKCLRMRKCGPPKCLRMKKCGRAKCLRDLEMWPGETSANEKISPAEMTANHAFHSQTFRRLQKPKCLRESEMRPAEMSVNEEFQKPKCLSALRAPPVAERFGASISDSHRHFDRCIFSFADISAASSPRGRAPGGLDTWVAHEFPELPGGAPKVP